MNWLRWSLVAQGILLVYYQVIEWVDLFPWNNARNGNGQETLDIAVLGIMLVLMLVTARRLWWATGIASALYALWLWLQIQSWWLPYFKGASPGWKRVYARFFRETIKFLPSTEDYLAPDACHIVLQFLVLGALVTTSLATLSLYRTRVSVDSGGRIAQS